WPSAGRDRPGKPAVAARHDVVPSWQNSPPGDVRQTGCNRAGSWPESDGFAGARPAVRLSARPVRTRGVGWSGRGNAQAAAAGDPDRPVATAPAAGPGSPVWYGPTGKIAAGAGWPCQ